MRKTVLQSGWRWTVSQSQPISGTLLVSLFPRSVRIHDSLYTFGPHFSLAQTKNLFHSKHAVNLSTQMICARLVFAYFLLLFFQQQTAVQATFDNEWYIRPHVGSPRLQEENGVPLMIFAYEIPSLHEGKTIQIYLLDKDCGKMPTDETLVFHQEQSENLLEVQVQIDTDTVVGSSFWSDENEVLQGTISFCLRVDLLFESESENFHETVSFTLGFANVLRKAADPAFLLTP